MTSSRASAWPVRGKSPSLRRRTFSFRTGTEIGFGNAEKELKTFKTSDAYSRAKEIADEILSDPAGEKSSFILPLTENATDFFSVLPENAVLIFDECKTLWDKFNALYKEHEERFHRLEAGGEAFGFTLFQYAEKDSFLSSLSRFRRLALQTFTGKSFFFEPLKIFNLTATPWRDT